MITISRTEELMDEHENAAHGAHFDEAKWQSAIDGDADASESKCALNQTHKVRLCVKLPTGQKTHTEHAVLLSTLPTRLGQLSI